MALDCALAYEQGDWERVRYKALSAGDIKLAFLDAVQWADELDRELARAA